jgi:hypothetical protein
VITETGKILTADCLVATIIFLGLGKSLDQGTLTRSHNGEYGQLLVSSPRKKYHCPTIRFVGIKGIRLVKTWVGAPHWWVWGIRVATGTVCCCGQETFGYFVRTCGAWGPEHILVAPHQGRNAT